MVSSVLNDLKKALNWSTGAAVPLSLQSKQSGLRNLDYATQRSTGAAVPLSLPAALSRAARPEWPSGAARGARGVGGMGGGAGVGEGDRPLGPACPIGRHAAPTHAPPACCTHVPRRSATRLRVTGRPGGRRVSRT